MHVVGVISMLWCIDVALNLNHLALDLELLSQHGHLDRWPLLARLLVEKVIYIC